MENTCPVTRYQQNLDDRRRMAREAYARRRERAGLTYTPKPGSRKLHPSIPQPVEPKPISEAMHRQHEYMIATLFGGRAYVVR